MASSRAAAVTVLGLGLLLSACTGDDADATPVPTTPTGGGFCGVYAEDQLAAVSGKDAADLEVTTDFDRATFTGPGGALVGAVCRVEGGDFRFAVEIQPSDINGDQRPATQAAIDDPAEGQVTLPASIGLGYAGPGTQDGQGRSVLIVGAYSVVVEVTGDVDGRDVVQDVAALTQQTVAAWKFSTDAAAPGPTATP